MAKRTAAKRILKNTRTLKKSAARPARREGPQPIDVYYWPTPNGHKVTIMLEAVSYTHLTLPTNREV